MVLIKRDGFPPWKCLWEDIYTENIFMKYEEQIPATTTINEFLRFHTSPSKIITANCREIRSNMRRFIIRIYGRHTLLMALFSVEWIISIKLLKVMAKVGNLSSFSGATAVQSQPKCRTFTVSLALFVPQPRWQSKTLEGSNNHLQLLTNLNRLISLTISTLTFNFIYYLTKEKYKMVASRK